MVNALGGTGLCRPFELPKASGPEVLIAAWIRCRQARRRRTAGALEGIDSVALRTPVADGVKVTLIAQLAPGATAAQVLPVIA